LKENRVSFREVAYFIQSLTSCRLWNTERFLMFTNNTARLKTTLRLCLARLKLIRNKKALLITTLKREVADLLGNEKEESAKIRVEALIREQMTVETMEMLELYAELLSVRAAILDKSGKQMPEDLRESIAGLIFANLRLPEIPELKQITTYFRSKFGVDFIKYVMNEDTAESGGVSTRIVTKLAVVAPSIEYKNERLKEIANEFGVAWLPDPLCGEIISHNSTDNEKEIQSQNIETMREDSDLSFSSTVQLPSAPTISPSINNVLKSDISRAANAQQKSVHQKTAAEEFMPNTYNCSTSEVEVDILSNVIDSGSFEYKTANEAAKAAREYAAKAAAAAEAAAALAGAIEPEFAERSGAAITNESDSQTIGTTQDNILEEAKIHEILNKAVEAAEAAEFAAEAVEENHQSIDVDVEKAIDILTGVPTELPAQTNMKSGTDIFSTQHDSNDDFDDLAKRFEALKKK